MQSKNINRPIYLLKGVLISYIITIILILIFSFLLTYTNLRESKMTLLNTIVMIISITTGSIFVSGKVKEQGWINGGLVGIIYYSILIFFNLLLLRPMVFDMFSLSKLVIATITGVIGGIIGINVT